MFFARASHSLLGLMLIQAFLFLFFLLGCSSSKKVVFDPERGFYNASFELKLELPDELKDSKAVIRYFLYRNDPSGPDPTATTGTVYTKGNKIPITSSCYVVASAFLNGQAVTSMSVHTFMFASNIVTDTYIDSSPQNLAFDGAEKIIRGFLSIPSVSMTTPFAYPYAPISYACIPCMASNPRFVRIEWLDPKHPKGNWLNNNATFDIFGTSSRGYRKKNFKITMEDEKVKFDFYNEFLKPNVNAATKFKEFSMRAHSQDGPFGYPYYAPYYMRNLFQEYTYDDAGVLGIHGRMVHVIYNSHYQGIHHLREKMSQTDFFQSYFGGEDEDYEAIGGDKWTYGGRMSAEEKALYTTYTDMHLGQNLHYTYLNNYVNWPSWTTFCILQHYSGNVDLGPLHNIHFGGIRKPKTWFGKHSGWHYQPSGPDSSYYASGLTEQANTVGPRIDYWPNLFAEAHPDFIQIWQDTMWNFLIKPDALLSAPVSIKRFDRIIKDYHLDDVVSTELFRWGYTNWNVTNWRQLISNLYNGYISVRTGILLNQYAAVGITCPVSGVLFSVKNKGHLKSGDKLVISPQTAAGNGNAVIYYTTNDQDPRLPGGAVNSNAISIAFSILELLILKDGEVKLKHPTMITARIKSDSLGWGPLNSVLVYAGKDDVCDMCGNIIITEISYNPDKNDTHFVELKNIGSKPVLMTGAVLKGLNGYTFNSVTLQPNQFYVIGLYELSFFREFKKNADDYQLYNFDTGSDWKFTLTDQFGHVVHEVEFSKDRPWSAFADGNGYSLVVPPSNYKIVASLANNSKTKHSQYWRYSANKVGSPWQDDPNPVPARPKIDLQYYFVSFSAQDGKDWIQFFNPTKSDIDISNWILSSDTIDKDEYIFPQGTIIPALSKWKIKESVYGFNIKQSKDVTLFERKLFNGEYIITGQFLRFDVDDNSMAF